MQITYYGMFISRNGYRCAVRDKRCGKLALASTNCAIHDALTSGVKRCSSLQLHLNSNQTNAPRNTRISITNIITTVRVFDGISSVRTYCEYEVIAHAAMRFERKPFRECAKIEH